jgi:ATP-dependent Clp protease ATP-binding subunit ClpX
MIACLDRMVRGQVRAKRDLAVAVYNHYLSQAHRKRKGMDLGRHHLLLMGPTGVGKTYMVNLPARSLGWGRARKAAVWDRQRRP